MEKPKDILIGWITSSWLQSTWTAAQVADGYLRDLAAAGYVIVPKECNHDFSWHFHSGHQHSQCVKCGKIVSP